MLEVRVKEHRLDWRDGHLPVTCKRAEHGAAYVDCLGCRLRDRQGAASIIELTRGRRGEQRTQVVRLELAKELPELLIVRPELIVAELVQQCVHDRRVWEEAA